MSNDIVNDFHCLIPHRRGVNNDELEVPCPAWGCIRLFNTDKLVQVNASSMCAYHDKLDTSSSSCSMPVLVCRCVSVDLSLLLHHIIGCLNVYQCVSVYITSTDHLTDYQTLQLSHIVEPAWLAAFKKCHSLAECSIVVYWPTCLAWCQSIWDLGWILRFGRQGTA